MNLTPEIKSLISKREAGPLEDLWIGQMTADPTEMEFFRPVAIEMNRTGMGTAAVELILLLLEELNAQGKTALAFPLLRDAMRMTADDTNLRAQTEKAIRLVFAGEPSLDSVLGHYRLLEVPDPVKAFDEILDWMPVGEGKTIWSETTGPGRVNTINMQLEMIFVDFLDRRNVSFPRAGARKLFLSLPTGHIFHEKLNNPAALIAQAASNPAALLRRLFGDFKRPMTAPELKAALAGIINATEWNAWWTKVRKLPELVPDPVKSSLYAWIELGSAAEETSWAGGTDLAIADLLVKIQAAVTGNRPIPPAVLAALAEKTAQAASGKIVDAVTALLVAEKIPGWEGVYTGPSLAAILADHEPRELYTAIADRRLRDRLVESIRHHRSDWAAILGDLFLREDEAGVLSTLFRTLLKGKEDEVLGRLVNEIASRPRKYPAQYLWQVTHEEALAFLDPTHEVKLLATIMDAFEAGDFKPYMAKLKKLFDLGELGAELIRKMPEDQAPKVLTWLERDTRLAPHRRESIIKEIKLIYSSLGVPKGRIWATQAGVDAKQAQLKQLVEEEIPENSRRLRQAVELGDLRENSEYKAARERHEQLSQLAAGIQSALAVVAVIRPETIELDTVKMGTKIKLRNSLNKLRVITILGPWESDPDHGVYSYQTPLAEMLIGKRVGSYSVLQDAEWKIESITRYDEE